MYAVCAGKAEGVRVLSYAVLDEFSVQKRISRNAFFGSVSVRASVRQSVQTPIALEAGDFAPPKWRYLLSGVLFL